MPTASSASSPGVSCDASLYAYGISEAWGTTTEPGPTPGTPPSVESVCVGCVKKYACTLGVPPATRLRAKARCAHGPKPHTKSVATRIEIHHHLEKFPRAVFGGRAYDPPRSESYICLMPSPSDASPAAASAASKSDSVKLSAFPS